MFAVRWGIFVVPGLLTAAEVGSVSFNDLRLEAGPAPRITEVSANREGAKDRGATNVTWESTGRWSLMWVPPVGAASSEGDGMTILELTSTRQVSSETALSQRLATRSMLALVHLGIGISVDERATVEITGYGGAGLVWQEGSAALRGAWEAGIRLGGTWTFPGGGQLGLGVRVLVCEARPNVSLNGQTYNLVMRSQGFIPALAVGWHF